MDKEIQQNIGSSNPNFPGFSFPQPEGQLFPLNNNLDNFGSNGDYGLADENVGNQNEVEQEFTFPIQPSSNEFMQNDGMGMGYFGSSGVSYDQSNFFTNFVSVSESLSQGSDFTNYQGSFSSSFTSGAQSMSLNSDMYQDNLTLTPQSVSQGSKFPYYQDILLPNVTQIQPPSQGSDLFSQQSNLSTNFAFNPQWSNQGADISYQNSLTNFASTTSQSFNQESSNSSNYQNNLSRNFNSTPQPWNHQGFNPQYPQPNLVTNNFSTLPPPLTQEYSSSYQANRTTNFYSTPQSIGQVPDLSYHQDNSSTNFSFTPQPPLNQGSLSHRLNHYNPSSNFTFTPQSINQGSPFPPLNHGNPSTNFTFTPQSLNQRSSLHPFNHNNPSFNLTSTPRPSNQGSSWRHLNHDNPSSNFAFTPQTLNQGSLSLPFNHGNPSTNFSFTPQLLNQGYSLPPQSHDNPSSNFTFTPQLLNQVSSILSQNQGFNNPNENPLGFPNERDDYSFNYLVARGGQQSSQHGESAGATSVPFSYNPTVVQQNPNNQAFNMAQPSQVMPQNNNYNSLLKSMMGAPTNNAATTAPPQPPSVDVGELLKSGSRSAAALLAANTQLFGQGLLGHYQALSTSMSRGFGRGAFPYPGHSRHSWRNAILESILVAGSGPDRGNRMAATATQQGSTAARGAMIDEQTLQAALASIPPMDLQAGEVRPRWTFRLPENLVAAGNTGAPRGGAVAGRGRGGERRGRKKSTGITINEGGRRPETGVTINEGGNVGENRRREGEGQGKGKEKVVEGVQGQSRKGKEKVVEGVHGRSRKGKEKLPIIEEEDEDDDDDTTDDDDDDITFEDDDFDMDMILNWEEYTNSMSLAQTSSSQQPPPPPPPAAN